MKNKKLRAVMLFFLGLCFGTLIFGGYMIKKEKPPVPDTVKSESGEVLFTGKDIMAGQSYYFSRGGQHIGTIWGHGSYLAPDWSADYLHRMGLFIAARHNGLPYDKAVLFSQKDFDNLDALNKARLTAVTTAEIKTNRLDQNGILTYTGYQAEAHKAVTGYYTGLFRNGNDRMGLQPGIVRSYEEGRIISAFFSWLAWSAGTNRPGKEITYTTNWPYDRLVGNEPIPEFIIWSIVSVILLILAIGTVLYFYNRYIAGEDYEIEPSSDFQEPSPSPSQIAVLPFFLVAILMFTAQIGTGSLTAHYTVEGLSFFGLSISKILPYAILRTWHLQLAIFWIATCFLATGLFIGPFVGHEPKHQWKLVILLFVAIVVVVLGTLTGAWLSVNGYLTDLAYYLGHQGYEYIELGRIWQLLLIAGMLIWLVLVLRAILPALKKEEDAGGLTHLLLYSSIAIPLFYMAGIMYGKGSHLSDAEYWRWWVVHLWVEGFFEVFATVVLAFILTRIKAVSEKIAEITVYLSIFLYLGSGVLGTFHHLYWSGTPAPLIALGAVFSALEVVPLTLLGFEAARNIKLLNKAGVNYPYKWPLYFFISVAFWNLVGAGVFGFMINPPIILYYIQGINTTPVHAHTALFGVYGLLAIALMLFSVRHIVKKEAWSDTLLKYSFWGLNSGLMIMTVFSLLPSGFYQFYYAVRYGMWYARSPEITSGHFIRFFSWIRIVPDIIFVSGAFALLLFLIRAIWISYFKKKRI